MTEMILLSVAWISPFFPLSLWMPRVDDRRVISGIIFVIRNGLGWRDLPVSYWPCKAIRINIQIPFDRVLPPKRHKIESMSGELKDWRRIHTVIDRCAHTVMLAIVLAAIIIAGIVIFWI